MMLSEGHCDICDAVGPLLDDLCRDCAAELYEGPLSSWMVRLLFAVDAARAPNAWREYLDFVLSRPGANDGLTAFSLDGPMWARLVLEAVAEAGA